VSIQQTAKSAKTEMLRAATTNGLRRSVVRLVRGEGDVVKSGGKFSQKEKASEDKYIHDKVTLFFVVVVDFFG